MHSFSEYNPDNYSVTYNGIPIEGFAEDDFINIEMDTEGFSDEIGSDGHVVRYKNCDQRATVTFSLMANSPTNAVLSAMHQADLKMPSGFGVGPLLVRDTQGASIFAAPQAWVQGFPKATLGKKVGNREWKIRVAKLESFQG